MNLDKGDGRVGLERGHLQSWVGQQHLHARPETVGKLAMAVDDLADLGEDIVAVVVVLELLVVGDVYLHFQQILQ